MALTTTYITDKFTAYQREVLYTRLSVAIWLIDDYTKKEIIDPVRLLIKEGNIKTNKNLSGYYPFTGLAFRTYTVIVEPVFYFRLENTIDISKIKILDLPLEFNTNGPITGISVGLKDVSRLQSNDTVEFRKPPSTVESRIITNINTTTKEIFWIGGPLYDFNTADSTIIALRNNPVVEITLKPRPSYPFPGNATLIRGQVLWASGRERGLPVNDANVNIVGKAIGTITDENGEFVLYFRGFKKVDLPNLTNLSINITKNGVPKIITTTEEGSAINVEEGKTLFIGISTFP